jgi:hypothetical protein
MSYPSKCRDYCFTSNATVEEKWDCIDRLKCNDLKKNVCSETCVKDHGDDWNKITECYVNYNCDDYTAHECEQKSNFKPYKARKCGPLGWNNSGRSDCWLDAVLYALFGSTTLSSMFNTILETLARSPRVTERRIAGSISNYLLGMNKPDWEDECKRKFKNSIISDIERYIKSWLKKKNGQIFYTEGNEWRLSNIALEDNRSTGFVDKRGDDVYSGNVYIILKIFAHFSEDIYLWNVQDTLHFTAGANSVKNHIKSIFDNHYDEIKEEKVFIYHMNSIKVNDSDLTRRSAISNFKEYTLQAIILGTPSHNYSYIKCYSNDGSNKFIKYDDNKPFGERTPQNQDTKIVDEFGEEHDAFGFIGLTSISFIYVRNDFEKILYGGEISKVEEFERMYLEKVPTANKKELKREYRNYKLEYQRMFGGL